MSDNNLQHDPRKSSLLATTRMLASCTIVPNLVLVRVVEEQHLALHPRTRLWPDHHLGAPTLRPEQLL